MISLRKTFYTKIILLIIVFILCIFYIRNLNNFNGLTSSSDHTKLLLPQAHHLVGSIDHVSEPENQLVNINDNHIQNDDIGINKYELEIQKDMDKQHEDPKLGADGKIAHLTDPDDIAQGELQLSKIALNEELSNHISYNRTVPDARHPSCRIKFYDIESLPTASVIIIFFNEPYSVLVRTVHSVINTTPDRLLREVILVDDGSSNVELKGKLDYYVKTRFSDKVKVLRLKNRLGLIRARLAGARLAKADVLVFLDAHCECVVQWLEPLVQRIKEKRTSVLVPIIDVIEAKNFYYSTNGYDTFQIGGFTLDGHFDWHDVPERERQRQRKECKDDIAICPTYSPTMAGGLFAISRDYFWEIGSYDEQMDGWGGENLEMSFRIWMCGGTLETIPCSRIGHIFREFHPYSFPNDKDTHGINTVRMAIVWMDDYQELLYMNRPDLRNHPDIGDVTHRQVLRNKLKCKSFEWYMRNIYPEKFIPTRNVINYGRVSALDDDRYCFDDLQQNIDEAYNLGVYSCYKHDIAPSQLFSYTYNKVLRTERSCATIDDRRNTKYILMIPCNSDDEVGDTWTYTINKQFKHEQSGLCIDRKNLDKNLVHAAVCDTTSVTQKWEFQKSKI
ncbi:polypeptide N-acetylgalactosaminyltransferase 1 [Chironomus tepperi]|uniref:polypeptide N-acetylgalactosaminyltransferase 1 n=1 Tax=Chironomus tepperi TaxID=113505 RepID=UPI00391F3DB4